MELDSPELERRLNAFQKEANMLRAKRDELNNLARSHADARDEKNAHVRSLVNEANEHKKRRDLLNEQVQHNKKSRDELNAEHERVAQHLEDLKRQKLPRQGRSISFIKREIQRLEFEHMTKVLSPGKEKALIEELARLRREIQQKERELESDPDLKTAQTAVVQSKDRAEKQHLKVSELAQSAQAEHESMVRLFSESDKIRKVADSIQAEFVQVKTEADKVHKAYVEIVEKIHQMEEELGNERRGGAAGQSQATAESQQRHADEIFERFKKGEKLSTEDLMSLQKAGLL